AMRFVNPAFRDYVLAAGISANDAGLATSVLEGTKSMEFQASPLLAFFLLLQLARRNAPVATEVFPAFYESLTSRSEGLRLEITDEDERRDLGVGTIRRAGDAYVPSLPDAPPDLGEDVVTRFSVAGLTDAPLRFRTRVRGVIVEHPRATVALGERQRTV